MSRLVRFVRGKLFHHHFVRMPQWFIISFLILGLMGLVISSYLVKEHYDAVSASAFSTPGSCPIFGSGCNTVTTSKYSEIVNIPVAAFGVFYYFLVFGLSLAYLFSPKRMAVLFLIYLTIIGFAFSLWFEFAQLVLISAICFYCMLSALISMILFVLDLVLLSKFRVKIDLARE